MRFLLSTFPARKYATDTEFDKNTRLFRTSIGGTGRPQLIDDGTDKILVNLADVTQLDSSGIGTIVRAFICLKHRGASLKLLRPRGNVRMVLETVHLLDVIPSIEDEAQGIASFR
jgi:ABC-type transporter Mla MlaB component